MPSERHFRRHFMLKSRPTSQTAAISGRFVRRQTVFSPHKITIRHSQCVAPFRPSVAAAPKGGFATFNEMPVNKP
ncbi:hypothetical protein [Neisseria polysaccharea]|uniref:hypothetical protein n=1 Tax=Neisseria polysaccharea TaxID=489 RepID=UPI002729963D|nr:hypothetical protein [Neisseria polysaccharea]